MDESYPVGVEFWGGLAECPPGPLGAVKAIKPPFESVGFELGVGSRTALPMFLRSIEAKLSVQSQYQGRVQFQ